MENYSLKKLLKLAIDPNATVSQLEAACDFIIADIEASNKRNAANPPPPLPTQEERLTDARRRANANLAKRRRR